MDGLRTEIEAVARSPACSAPANHDAGEGPWRGRTNRSAPNSVALADSTAAASESRAAAYDCGTRTANPPFSPRAAPTAASTSTIPAPCASASFPVSDAADMRSARTSAGSGAEAGSASRIAPIRTAAAAATVGAAMLVPPYRPNGSCDSARGGLVTGEGTNPYAPTPTMSGFGCPRGVGPRLVKSTRWPAWPVVLPKRGWPANAPCPTNALLVAAPTVRTNGDAPGVPVVPYPCPELPALATTRTPGYLRSSECGTAIIPWASETASAPGTAPISGNADMPQLCVMTSARAAPEYRQDQPRSSAASPSPPPCTASNPAAHMDAYRVSPNQRALTGTIDAPGATPRAAYFSELLYTSYPDLPAEAIAAAEAEPCPTRSVITPKNSPPGSIGGRRVPLTALSTSCRCDAPSPAPGPPARAPAVTPYTSSTRAPTIPALKSSAPSPSESCTRNSAPSPRRMGSSSVKSKS